MKSSCPYRVHRTNRPFKERDGEVELQEVSDLQANLALCISRMHAPGPVKLLITSEPQDDLQQKIIHRNEEWAKRRVLLKAKDFRDTEASRSLAEAEIRFARQRIK